MGDVSRIDTLLDQITDPTLRANLAREVAELAGKREFGLIYERHLPEIVRLPHGVINKGSTVMLRDGSDETVWRVTGVRDGVAALRDDDGNTREMPDSHLIAARVFGQPIYPGLRVTGQIKRGGGKPHHLVINGENHHALQALKYTHGRAVDVIYIDPPYNTGGDFAYSDKYVGADDRYRHSKWLSFMEGRLRLARDLLKPTGVIIVAIDDNEQAHLKLLMDQVFGPQNFLASVTWLGSSKNDARFTSGGLDYMLFYGRSKSELIQADARWSETKRGYDVAIEAAAKAWQEAGQDPSLATRLYRAAVRSRKSEMEKGVARYNEIDETGRLFFRADLSSPNPRENLKYDLLHPVTGLPVYRPANGWVYSQETMQEKLAEGRILFGPDHNQGAYYKRYLDEVEDQSIRPIIEVDRRASSLALAKLLGEKRFKFPKDPGVIAEWINSVTMRNPQAVVVDFFAGSGSTGQAVMELNESDGGHRRCVLVTNNEVDEKRAKALRKEGHQPGDAEWEKWGIFEYVCRPRIDAIVTGVRPDGTTHSNGLDENVTYGDLTYLDRTNVERGKAFELISHLLWAMAGATGAVIDRPVDTFSLPDEARYGVLFDVDHWKRFVSDMRVREGLTHAFVVTDSDSAFNHVARSLPNHVHAVQLYENYLSTFEINTGEH